MLRGEWDFDGTLAWTACTHDSTGAAADADAAPTWVIRNAATGAQVITGTMDAVAGVTGQYLDTVALTAANGFAADTLYVLRVAATVGAVVAAAADVFAVKVAIGRDASGYISGVTGSINTLDALLTAVQGTDGDTLKTLSDQIDSVGAGAGLNAQEVRDAMKLAPSAGAAADGSIDNLLAALPAAVEAELTGYQVNVQPVVSTDGQITLYQGYDYNSADNRAVEFTIASPDFTGATTALKFDADTYAGSVVNPGVATQLLRFEFTAVQTTAMTAGHHAYRLEVTRAGRLLLEETGVIHIKE